MVRTAALSWLLGLAVCTQTVSEDPGGWTKAKWGMTRQQISDLFADQHPQKRQLSQQSKSRVIEHLVIPDFKVQNHSCEVTFEFGDHDDLDQVYIQPDRRSPMMLPYVKDRFLQALTGSYGAPQHSTELVRDGSAAQDKWDWVFPRTQIELIYIREKDRSYDRFDLLQLNYVLRKKASDL